MHTYLRNNFSTILGAISLVFLLGIIFTFADWTPPAFSPPTCPASEPACNTPLNVGDTTQTKQGGLIVGATSGGFSVVNGNSFFLNGNVGIGTEIPGQKLDVAGTINAFNITTGDIDIQGKKACLADGTNCPGAAASVTCYQDADGDNYTTGATQAVAAGDPCPAGFITSPAGSDCYDSNASARPGQTSHFTSHRGDSSFDYDCNSLETKDVTSYTFCIGGPSCKACTFSGCDAGTCINTSATPACGITYTPSGFTADTCDLGGTQCNCTTGTTQTVACK